jgi:hypothetical protein
MKDCTWCLNTRYLQDGFGVEKPCFCVMAKWFGTIMPERCEKALNAAIDAVESERGVA